MEREGEREYPSESIMDTFWVMAWAFTQQLISTDNPGWKVTQRIFTGPTSKNLKVKNTYNRTRTIPRDIHSICFYMHDPQSSWWLTTGSVFVWTGVEMDMQAIPFPVTFNTSQTKPLWKFIGCIYILLYIHVYIYIYNIHEFRVFHREVFNIKCRREHAQLFSGANLSEIWMNDAGNHPEKSPYLRPIKSINDL